MATTLLFTENGTASFTASGAVTIACWGAGGRGGKQGNGGSGGAYAATLKTVKGPLYINVGQATDSDGEDSYVTFDGNIICRAPGGKRDGTIAHQTALLVGNLAVYYGGQGWPDFAGYGNSNGSGGGSSGSPNGNGEVGQSAFFATRTSGARGGGSGNGCGGDGGFYCSGPMANAVIGATSGTEPGGGGGGSYDNGQDNSGAGARGLISLTF